MPKKEIKINPPSQKTFKTKGFIKDAKIIYHLNKKYEKELNKSITPANQSPCLELENI